jgi:hypothetical protein
MASWCESEARRHPRIQPEMLKLFDQIKRPAGRAA